MARPERAPGLVDALAAAVSARVSKRVADAPAMADAWAWSEVDGGTEVRNDDVVVRITGSVATEDTLVCSCLMAPKCLHRLAVATVLADASAHAEAADEAVAEVAASPVTPLTPEGEALVANTRAALAGLLALGAHRADSLVRAELTRLAWEARAIAYPRLGRALTRVVQSLRLYDAGHPTFALATLVADVNEALSVATLLARDATPERVGEARRSYGPVGALRLFGLVAEPVLVAGSAGVVTHMADARGRLWEVPDVRPRAAGQAIGVYDVAPPLSSLSHRQLVREGLFVQDATAAGPRLGAGASVHAVRAGGVAWDAEPLTALWKLGEAGGLRFVAGEVLGLSRGALWIGTSGGPVAVVPGSEHASLPWRENLRLLARAPGLELLLIGRPVVDRPRALVGLGVAGPELTLPEAWGGKVNLGLDRLTTSMAPLSQAAPVVLDVATADTIDALTPLRRRVERLVLGGVGSLPGEARARIDLEARRLADASATGGAALLTHLADAAIAARRPQGAAGLATAWLATATYLSQVDTKRAALAW